MCASHILKATNPIGRHINVFLSYRFLMDSRGLHSSPFTGCSMTLFGY
jgi:hypothetical protein